MPEWFCPPVLLWLFPPPPFPPPPPHPLWLLAFRECRLGGATDELGGEDEGVPGDPVNHKYVKFVKFQTSLDKFGQVWTNLEKLRPMS